MINATKVTVNTTATLIVSAAGSSPGDRRTAFIGKPSVIIYIGGPAVTVAQGFPVDTTEVVALDLSAGDTVYAIAGSTTDVRTFVTRSDT